MRDLEFDLYRDYERKKRYPIIRYVSRTKRYRSKKRIRKYDKLKNIY